MVFKRKAVRRARPRTFARSRSRSSSSSMSVEKMILPAAGYGAVRNFAADKIKSVIGTPFGAYTDEAVLGIAGYFIAKKNLFGMGNVGKAMLIVETASLSNQVVSPMINQAVGGTSNSNGITYY